MHIPKRADEWLFGRWTAKRLLTSPGMPWEGQPFASLTIENAPEGAPYLADTDVPGCISLSHRGDLAAAAIFDQAGCAVGIDLELAEPRAENFIRDFFTETEAEYALNLEGAARHEWVTLAWSAKEAVLKAWQKGLRVDTRAIELIPGEGQPGPDGWTRLAYRSTRKDFPACWLGWRRVGDYVLTLAYTLAEYEGEVLPLLRPSIVGRNPVDSSRRHGLLAVPDLSRTMSRNHVLIEPDVAAVWVTDLGSGNGTTIIHPRGDVERVRPGLRSSAPVGARLTLGERILKITAYHAGGTP